MKIKRYQFLRSEMLLGFLIVFSSLACRLITGLPSSIQTKPADISSIPVTQVTLLPSPSPLSTWTFAPAPTRESSPSALATLPPLVATVDPTAFQVQFHPDSALYVGDQVSIEVIAPARLALEDVQVSVAVEAGHPLGEAKFERFGIAGRRQATLTWVWDTRGYDPGIYQVQFTLQPGGTTWNETVSLLPVQELPEHWAGASWAEARNDCCVIHYITGTAAERDLAPLLAEIDLQAQDVEEKFGVEFDEPVTFTLLPRILGHGGFASSEIHVSYLDRNYTAGVWQMVVHHEMVHILDARLGADFRPSLFVEGLAVYLTGGHFKPEPLMPRAAALLDSWGNPRQPGLDWYIPLPELADDFYAAQHEVSYLQAAALVEYMVNTYGWDAFMAFYQDVQPDSESQAQAIAAALRVHFGLSLEELELDFLEALRKLPADPLLEADVRQVTQFFNAVRRYQLLLDPSAYFRTAWLLDTVHMRQEGIVADYLRHPEQPVNLTLETMLAAAGGYVAQGQSEAAETYLSAVNVTLDALEAGEPDPFTTSQVASDYQSLVQMVIDNPEWVGADSSSRVIPQRIVIEGASARVWLSVSDAQQVEVRLDREASGSWRFLSYGAQSFYMPSLNIENPEIFTWGFHQFGRLVPTSQIYGAQ